MARTMKVGATFPNLQGMASDSTGAALNLSSAESLELICFSGAHEITGPVTPIWPPIADPDLVHFWNWEYTFALGDTAFAGSYNVYLKVIWTLTEIEFFPDDGAELLIIEPVD